MYRVMPWAYPTIPGQSSGGASVDPIPDPSGDYFDFSNAEAHWANSVTLEEYGGGVEKSRAFPILLISGIGVVNASSVARTTIYIKDQPSYSTPLTDANMSIAYSTNRSDLNINPAPQLLASPSDVGKNVTITGGSIEFKSYDSEGNLLQSYVLVIT